MEEETKDQPLQFHEMGLDDRILKGIAKLSWATPTLIQEKAIPLLIEGKDVLVRARTGSGKTAAFAIPVIQKILNSKQLFSRRSTKALILAPSKELCSQIHKVICDLTIKCAQNIRCLDISQLLQISAQKPLLIEKPDILVSTPTRALQHIEAGNITLKESLEILVIDEADLVFSFGHENEVKKLLIHLPKIYQAILASATLSEDVKDLKNLVLHNPVTLKLEEPELAPTSQLSHYQLAAEEIDKATILYAILKLHLIRGKSIIFVNTVDRCYKLKLFLEQFKIPTCVLNSELPAKIRCLSVSQFNQGLYDVIIASDEKALDDAEEISTKESKKEKKSKRKIDKDSGVSRGIDFHCVSNVINFDFPLDVNSYIHRAGRTARGNNEGSVLSFVSLKERSLKDAVEKFLGGKDDNQIMKAYQFKIEEIESFRYRTRDAWKAVTRIAVRESRLKEIKQQLFSCQKLKSFFEDNPQDLEALRHDKALHTVRHQPHLADVPDYIVPPTLKNFNNARPKRKRDHSKNNKVTSSVAKYEAKKNNPLFSMDFDGPSKKKKIKK